MSKIGRVDVPEARWEVQKAAERYIAGYAAPHLVAAEDEQRAAKLVTLFGPDPAPEASIVVAAADDRGMLAGAAVIEPSVSDVLMSRDHADARKLAMTHRTLAALFVVPGARGQGIGRQLLSEAAYWALPHGGRYLDGFVDDRNDSVDFYRSAGATVVGHNTGLPARPPTHFPLWHNPSVNGTWFYVDAWRLHQGLILCQRCQSVLEFVDEDGGDLRCPICPPPPAQ